MKVVVKGTKPEDIPFNLGCTNCGTVLEVLEKELVKSATGPHVICPICSAFVEDNRETRSIAATKLDSERIKKEREEKLTRRWQKEYDDSYRDYYERDNDKPSGGPSGPLNPPELPHYVNVVGNFCGINIKLPLE